MKVFIIACLAVAALAESDPALVYTNGMYHTGYPMVNSYIHSPIVSSLHPVQYVAQPTMKKAEEKPVEKKMPEVMEKKVVVEKQPEPIVYSGIHPSQYINPFAQTYIKPVVVGPRYVAKNGEVEHIVHKREAEAEPWTVVGSPFYSGLHHPRFYTQPAAYYTNKATFINPYTGDVTGKVTNDAIIPTNYAQKGKYVARAPGTNTVHIAKREAEADPLTVLRSPFYSSLYPTTHAYYNAHPYTYSNLYNRVYQPSSIYSPYYY